MSKTLREIELDEKIARIRRQNEEIMRKKKLIEEEIKVAEEHNAVVNPKKTYDVEKSSVPTLRADILSSNRKKIITYSREEPQRNFRETNNEKDDAWRREREKIDNDRIQRQKAASGWKREWDAKKHFEEKEVESETGLYRTRNLQVNLGSKDFSHGGPLGRITKNNFSEGSEYFFESFMKSDRSSMPESGSRLPDRSNLSQRLKQKTTRTFDFREKDNNWNPHPPVTKQRYQTDNVADTRRSENLLTKTISNPKVLSESRRSKAISNRLEEKNRSVKPTSVIMRRHFQSSQYKGVNDHDPVNENIDSLQDKLKNIVINVQTEKSKPIVRTIHVVDDLNSKNVTVRSDHENKVIKSDNSAAFKKQIFTNSKSTESTYSDSGDGKSLRDASKVEVDEHLPAHGRSEGEIDKKNNIETCTENMNRKKETVIQQVEDKNDADDDDEWEDTEDWTDVSDEEHE